MQRIFCCLAVLVLALLAVLKAPAASLPSGDDMPMPSFDDRFSTNWYVLVWAALPVGDSARGSVDFQAVTNSLARTSNQGDTAAQALWGFALIVLRSSPQTIGMGLDLMRGSAEKGDLAAMLNLGYLFEGGKYVSRNYSEALHWFRQAAEIGNSEGQLQLGGCYHYGLGTNHDFSMSAKYYRLSASQTNFVAMKSLGFLLMNGLGVAKNEDEAKYWLTRAAKEGKNRRAMYNLGVLYIMKFPDTNSMAEGFKWVKQSAELGDALGAYELSNFYFRGWGATQTNLENAHLWRYRAAIWGATEAQFFMGQDCQTGDGVPKNLDHSLLWYQKAAAKNHPEALYDLTLHFLESKTNRASLEMACDLMMRAAQMGHREAQFQCALSCFRGDVRFDFDQGKEWLAKAAENGWPKAQFLFYSGSAPVKDCRAYPQDKTQAIRWLRRAAENGFPLAQSTLAVMMIRGVDVPKDNAEAEKLLRDSAEHGFPKAQNDLGFAIMNGDVASTDATEAAMWINLAHTHATDSNLLNRANFNLSQALSRLTADQKQEVENRVNLFKPIQLPQDDPKMKGWQKNPDYQQEDGLWGH